jgi:hypothetical protein
MKKNSLLLIFAIFCFSNFVRSEDWQPSKTVAVIIGILEWDDTSLTTYPTENREDKKFYELLKTRGVPESQIIFLSDGQGTYKNITDAIKTYALKASSDYTFIFYYAGHGSFDDTGAYFYNYDSQKNTFYISEIADILIANFKGKKALLFADCCYSGRLNDVADKLEKNKISTLVLTSVVKDNTSTGEWTFTESLNDIFSGILTGTFSVTKIDSKTAANYVLNNMKNADEQPANSYQTATFPTVFNYSTYDTAKSIKCTQKYMEALSENVWYKVEIIGNIKGKYKIHYIGWDDEWDELVSADKLREITFKTYKVGTKVQVLSDEVYYPATVMKIDGIFHYIHYDDYDTEWDEWVTSSSIKEK